MALGSVCLLSSARATTLSTGDIAIAGFGPKNPADAFAIVPLVNFDQGTTITLTDDGWLSSGGFLTGTSLDGTITFTAATDIRAGTILGWTDGGTGNTAGFSYANETAGGSTPINLDTKGESFSIVVGGASAVSSSTSASSVLWALQSGGTGTWSSNATSETTSAQPTIGSTFTPAFSKSSLSYNGVTTAATKATWQTLFGNTANYSTSNGNVQLPTGSYSVISNLTWNGTTNTTWDTTTTNKNFTDGTNTTWFNTSDNVTFGTTGAGAISVAAAGLTAGTVAISNASGAYTFSGGTITGASLAKSGNGSATLSSNASFSGGTAISAGTLIVGGSLSGSVSMTGGTLGGTGTISSAVTATAGTVEPGNGSGVGKLTLQSGLSLSGGGTYTWQLATLKDNSTGTAGTDFDQLALTGGNLALGGSSKLTLDFSLLASGPNSADPFWHSNHSWSIIAGTGTTNTGSTNFFQITDPTFADGTFSVTTDALGDATLQFVAIPEPQTWLSAFSGLGTLLLLQRRRRRNR
jgi:autotransporter-associated beta strand protein